MMKSKPSQKIIDGKHYVSLEWLSDCIDELNKNVHKNTVFVPFTKNSEEAYTIDRDAFPELDDRIEVPEGRLKLLGACVTLLERRMNPVIEEGVADKFVEMNFQGCGEKPNSRVKLKYDMKPSHLLYFFHLVYIAVFKGYTNDYNLREFRNAITESFEGFESFDSKTISTYFTRERPAVIAAYDSRIKTLKALSR